MGGCGGRRVSLMYSTVAFSTWYAWCWGVFIARVLTAPDFYMPELPETSALLQIHPARVSADTKLDAKCLQVLLLPIYQCCESQQ